MANRFQLELKGLQNAKTKLKGLGFLVIKGGKASLFRSGQEIITRSKEQFVPIDTGALEGTLNVLPPEENNGEVVVQLVAGGPAAPYAVFVHETNKNYRNGRQWKYLETPAKEATPRVERNLREDLKDLLT